MSHYAALSFRSLCASTLLTLLTPLTLAQQPDGSKLIAIEILLEPSAVLSAKAKAVEARLRKEFPQWDLLNPPYWPHITLVQQFVRASDLDTVAAAVTSVMESEASPDEITVTGYQSEVSEIGLSPVVYQVERSPELLRLERKIVEAVQPFAVSGGTEDAFAKPPGGRINGHRVDFSAEWIKRVETYVPEHSGELYSYPFVVLGSVPGRLIKELRAEPFEKFATSGRRVAIYQVGYFAVARKELWAWGGN